MKKKNKLSEMQKKRLATYMQEAVSKRQSLYLAQIMDAHRDKLFRMACDMSEADARFARALKARGLCVGDVVRMTDDGPYRDTVFKISDISEGGVLTGSVAGQEMSVLPEEVQMDEPLTRAKGKR